MTDIPTILELIRGLAEYENEPDDKGRHKYDVQTFQRFMDAQKALARKLFLDNAARLLVLNDKNYLADQTTGLHPTVAKWKSLGSSVIELRCANGPQNSTLAKK